MGRAMIIVDVQNDFCPGGSLAVAGGDRVAARISAWLTEHGGDYAAVLATADWHPAVGGFPHFSDTPNYRDTWPPHCVQGTEGAAFHPNLSLPDGTITVRKGQDSAAYSGFEGRDERGRSLPEILQVNNVDSVDICGLATDYCVRATALDASAAGLHVRLLAALVAGVAPETSARALDEMRAAGVAIE